MPSFGQNLESITSEFRAKVNALRENRIIQGTDVTLAGYGAVALQGRPEDLASLQGLAFGAQLRMSMGDETPMVFMDRDNVEHSLTPMQMVLLWKAGADFVTATYATSWTIKEMNPFTTDPANPLLWA